MVWPHPGNLSTLICARKTACLLSLASVSPTQSISEAENHLSENHLFHPLCHCQASAGFYDDH